MIEVVTWVEIPAADFERAANFYRAVIGPRFNVGEFMGAPHGFLNNEETNHGGAVIPNRNPSLYVGPIIYIGVDNLDGSLKQASAMGGEVLLPKTNIGPDGAIAVIRDTEGNRIGLHVEGAQS
jgi:predicted enzyme related to lactoylglutathione lyase